MKGEKTLSVICIKVVIRGKGGHESTAVLIIVMLSRKKAAKAF